MPVFKFNAVDSKGNSTSGQIAFNSRQELLAYLDSHQLYPVKIYKSYDIKSLAFVNLELKKKVSLEELSAFLRQLYTLFHAGITIPESLETIASQTANTFLRRIITGIQEKIEQGKTLSNAMGEYPKVFPAFLLSMIETGERAGQLEEVLLKMSLFYDKEFKTKQRIKNATFYPKFLATMSIGLVVFMLAFVLPAFIAMYESAQVQLPGITRSITSLSSFVQQNLFILVILSLAAWASFRYLKQFDSIIELVDKVKLLSPILKEPVIKGMSRNFAGALSMLLASGISMIRALEITSRVMGNRQGEKEVLSLKDRVDAGVPLSRAMNDMGFFPPILSASVSTGERSGSLDNVLKQVAHYYEEELDKSLDKMIRVIEPLMIVFMAVVIGFLVIAMIIPLFDMVSAIS